MTLGQKIKELREARDWTQEKLAERSGLGGGHISRLEADGYKNPSANTLLKIARALRTNPSALFRAAGYTTTEKKDKPRSFQELLEDCLTVSPIAIPIVEAEVHAGSPTSIVEYAYWEKPRVAGRNVTGIRVRGFCLSPVIEEEDTIFVDSDISAQNGDIVLVATPDEFLLGHFHQTGGKLWLTTNERLTEITEDYTLKGVVVEVNRKLRK
jgi:transcriptional regulator with XRE-family HTH domain